MNNQIRSRLTILFLTISVCVLAQNSQPEPGSFSWYADIVSKVYNINCKLPDNFTDLKSKHVEIFKDENNWKMSSPYFPVIQSNDKECVLMYNLLPLYGFWTKNLVIGEIAGMLGLDSCVPSQCDSIQLENHVTITTGKSVHDSFNADSIITFEIPRNKAYMDKYKYCTSMMIVKNDRATMILKWFFTENGQKNKDKYISMLNNSIEYKNGKWNYDKRQIPSEDQKALSQILQVVTIRKADLENK
jgi:hypothetical protein